MKRTSIKVTTAVLRNVGTGDNKHMELDYHTVLTETLVQTWPALEIRR